MPEIKLTQVEAKALLRQGRAHTGCERSKALDRACDKLAATIAPEAARTVPAPVCACCGEESAHGSKFCRKCSAKGCKEAAHA